MKDDSIRSYVKIVRDLTERKLIEEKLQSLVERLKRTMHRRIIVNLLTNAEASEAVPPAPPTLRILVVDDNADAAKLMAMMLTARGYDVRTESSGAAGLEAAQEFPPLSRCQRGVSIRSLIWLWDKTGRIACET